MPDPSRDPIDCVTAHRLAIELLRSAGFVLGNVSMSSESCYYYHPARGPHFLLRVSIHKAKKKANVGLTGFVAKATFSPRVAHSEWHVHNTVATAIGRYFLAAEPPPSRYDGPRQRAVSNGAIISLAAQPAG